MMIPAPFNKKELVSKSLFSRGLKKIHKALDKNKSTDKGAQLLIQAAVAYHNPHAQYAIYVLAQNNIIHIPESQAENMFFEMDKNYYDFSTMSQVKTLLLKAQKRQPQTSLIAQQKNS